MEVTITSVIIGEDANTAVVHKSIVGADRYDGEGEATWEKNI